MLFSKSRRSRREWWLFRVWDSGWATHRALRNACGIRGGTLIHQVITVMKLKGDVREQAETHDVPPAINECLVAAAVSAIRSIGKGKR